MPTYGYELDQAVKDGYLVDFLSAESKLKFLEEGIAYDELPENERQQYEDTFTDENGSCLSASAPPPSTSGSLTRTPSAWPSIC